MSFFLFFCVGGEGVRCLLFVVCRVLCVMRCALSVDRCVSLVVCRVLFLGACCLFVVRCSLLRVG